MVKSQDNTQQKLVPDAVYIKHHSLSIMFREGYESATKQKPYNYNIDSKHDAIFYARGRAFAVYTAKNNLPRAVWRKGVLAKTAGLRLIQAAKSGWVL